MKKIYSFFFMLHAVAISAFAEVPQPPAPSEPDGIIGGHEYVDLGLPSGTLWATYNIGTSSPYETGPYFAWGEVEPRERFTWENYKFYKDHIIDPEKGAWVVLDDIGDDICGTEYDAARHHWGNGWRLPNEQEAYELRMICWHRWTVENGVEGTRVYGPNEKSIFLPKCGYGQWYDAPIIDILGAYWTGASYPENTYMGVAVEPSTRAVSIFVDSSGLQSGDASKPEGANIRAVINPKDSGILPVTYNKDAVSLWYQNGQIMISDAGMKCRLDIFDLSGRTVFSGTAEEGVCPLPDLSHGIYLVSISDGDVTIKTQKITIK